MFSDCHDGLERELAACEREYSELEIHATKLDAQLEEARAELVGARADASIESARADAAEAEVVGYRDAFAEIAHCLTEYWKRRASDWKEGGDGVSQETLVDEGVAVIRAVGKVVERRALALAEQSLDGQDDKQLEADVAALIRESLGGRQGKG